MTLDPTDLERNAKRVGGKDDVLDVLDVLEQRRRRR